MKVGDLVKPKCEAIFKLCGYAVVTEFSDRDVIVVWAKDNTDRYLKRWDFENNMELVCK